MSFHATVKGSIQYSNQLAFNVAVEAIKSWLSEGVSADEKTKTIEIEYGFYRNLVDTELFQTLFPSGHATGLIIWASLDGGVCGGTMSENGEEHRSFIDFMDNWECIEGYDINNEDTVTEDLEMMIVSYIDSI